MSYQRENPLGNEEQAYLQRKGFNIHVGAPSSNTSFPYLILKEDGEVRYRIKENVSFEGNINLENNSLQNITDFIEEILTCRKFIDNSFYDSTDTPINIFILKGKSRWIDIARILKSRFK